MKFVEKYLTATKEVVFNTFVILFGLVDFIGLLFPSIAFLNKTPRGYLFLIAAVISSINIIQKKNRELEKNNINKKIRISKEINNYDLCQIHNISSVELVDLKVKITFTSQEGVLQSRSQEKFFESRESELFAHPQTYTSIEPQQKIRFVIPKSIDGVLIDVSYKASNSDKEESFSKKI